MEISSRRSRIRILDPTVPESLPGLACCRHWPPSCHTLGSVLRYWSTGYYDIPTPDATGHLFVCRTHPEHTRYTWECT